MYNKVTFWIYIIITSSYVRHTHSSIIYKYKTPLTPPFIHPLYIIILCDSASNVKSGICFLENNRRIVSIMFVLFHYTPNVPNTPVDLIPDCDLRQEWKCSTLTSKGKFLAISSSTCPVSQNFCPLFFQPR